MKKSVLSLCVLAGLGLASAEVFAHKAGDWLVRGRIININPDSSSNEVAVGGAAQKGYRVGVEDAWTLDIDITNMISDNFGVELLLDPSTKHEIVGKDAIAGLGKIGEVTVLPPALIAQYHFSPKSQFQPYVGLGLNYTMFFKGKSSTSLYNALNGVTDLKVDNKAGWVAQAGADYDMGNGWFVNADVKYIGLKTTATFDVNTKGTAAKASVDVDINPWVYGIGIGKRF